MRKIYIFDTTLRDGEQSPGVNLNTQEKVEIALQLEKLGVDVIEAGFPAASPGDLAAVREVAKAVKKPVVLGLARARDKDIEAVREALEGTANPGIHVFIATSPIHRQYKLRMEKHEVKEAARQAILLCKQYFDYVEFSCEDAARTEIDFLIEMVTQAVELGVKVVNIPDTVGYMNPDEYGRIFKTLKEQVPGIENVRLSCHCHDDLGMATANALAAIQNGADQVEGTFNGIGERAGNTALEEVVMALDTRYDYFGCKTTLNLSEIARTSQLVSRLTGMVVPGNKAIVGANAFAHESGIHQDGFLKEKTTYEIMTPETIGLKESKLVLGKHSGRHAFRDKLEDMGYTLQDEQLNEAFSKFKELADKKKYVTDDDIRALVDEEIIDTSGVYTLGSIRVMYENVTPTATVTVKDREGEGLTGTASGNGSVDAIYKAIEQATGEAVDLEEYSVRAVSSWQDALGEAHVVLRQANIRMGGRGISTDVLESSARAYLDALNRIIERRASGTERESAQL